MGTSRLGRTRALRASRPAIALLVAMTLAGGCRPAPASPPPLAAESPGWSWGAAEVPRIRGGNLNDVAELGGAFVAVGTVMGQGWTRGLILVSPDGIAWSTPDLPLDGLQVASVAAGPGGFVVAGTRIAADAAARPVMLRSTDLDHWEEVPVPAGQDPIVLAVVRWAGDRYVTLLGLQGRLGGRWAELESRDGIAWTWRDLDGPRMPLQTTAGWWMVDRGGTWSAVDGSAQEGPRVPAAADGRSAAVLEASAVLPTGTLLVGEVPGACPPFQSCPMESSAWWSADGLGFAPAAEGDPGWPTTRTAPVIASAAGRIYLVEDERVTVSDDGWRWRSLAGPLPPLPAQQPGASGTLIRAAAGADHFVAVGAYGELSANGDGSIISYPWIVTASP